MDDVKYFSEAGLKKLKDELHYLETIERPKISQQISEARDKGDLSENAEYDAAKEAQGLLEAKIAQLKELVSKARILDESKIDDSKVLLFSNVRIKNRKNNSEMTYVIVPENESNLKEGKISVDSPISKGLLGKKIGDKVDIQVPAGQVTFEIIDVSRD
ncbi:MAG: transcription elongation factor GreA [Bacteroidales bacterium]